TAEFARAFAAGISWGDAKQQLFERIDSELSPLRERYNALMAEPEKIEALLKRRGQQLSEQLAAPLLDELRHAVGLRDLSTAGDIASDDAGVARAAPPLFKQYREKDGRFYFKLTAGDGTLLIQSEGFDSPRGAGQLIAVIKQAEQGDQLQSELFKLEAEVDAVLAALAM
ncbi:DUF1508 domain-containing protein, partial [Escherichia coli]|uniref:DUF1508 domain-containing protein n=1 Tax=Escherichia coli TaxID=562 RepID=UPI0034E3F8BB